jgi:hypothetical protein
MSGQQSPTNLFSQMGIYNAMESMATYNTKETNVDGNKEKEISIDSDKKSKEKNNIGIIFPDVNKSINY